MNKNVKVLRGWASFGSIDLSLTNAQPLRNEGLRDAGPTICRSMELMLPIGSAHSPHMVRIEPVRERVGCPERARYRRWSDEIVTVRPLTCCAELGWIVCGQVSSAAAVSLCLRRRQRAHPRLSEFRTKCSASLSSLEP
jgi:hypothetical protein